MIVTALKRAQQKPMIRITSLHQERRMGLLVYLRWLAAPLLLALGGCASAPVTQAQLTPLWLDSEFAYNAATVRVDAPSLFALEPALVADLKATKLKGASAERRVRYLIATVLESKTQPFSYRIGHSTVAAETWASRRGDCLSLTVLTYALARELGLQATMQEVPVPTSFDRRGGVDYLVGHVNLFINHAVANELNLTQALGRGVIIDFEPTIGSGRIGLELTEGMMLARYLNNLGAEFLARADRNQAYAHFKAAMLADPQFWPAQTNMAGLYRSAGYGPAAENLLLWVASHADTPDTALRSLQRMMLAQGREADAANFEAQLIARQAQDPYHWISLGLEQYRAQNYRAAIDALEKAQGLTTGFVEIHRYLALAYWHNGQANKAKAQLSTLAAIDDEDPSLALLNRKFSVR